MTLPLPRLDTLLDTADQALRTLFAKPAAHRDSPAAQIPGKDTEDAQEKTISGALMRVNHAGEVAAQALYQGQQLFARDPGVRRRLAESAQEEQDHLAWCAQRLSELDAHTSRLNPVWYLGAYSIGAVAGLVGDQVSLGFVAETEKQVVEHLQDHLNRLPDGDTRSQAILEQMALDEANHGRAALLEGGVRPPAPIRRLMGLGGEIIRQLAYRV